MEPRRETKSWSEESLPPRHKAIILCSLFPSFDFKFKSDRLDPRGCVIRRTKCVLDPGFGNQFIFGYEVEVELSIQLENGNEVEYE